MKKEAAREKKKKVKFIKPPNTLKLKVGSGGIPQERIQDAQLAMEMFETDFSPIAHELIRKFSAGMRGVEKAVAAKVEFDRDSIVYPVMQLKANGGMFKYTLMSDVADICLQFMEAVNDYNGDTLEVIRAHENSLRSIIGNDLKGNGGHEGYKLVQELHQACQRYFKKYKI
jgi:hypothetical protein